MRHTVCVRRGVRRGLAIGGISVLALAALAGVGLVGQGCDGGDCATEVPYRVEGRQMLTEVNACAVFTSTGTVHFRYRTLLVGQRYTERTVTPGPVSVSLLTSCGAQEPVTATSFTVSQTWQGSLSGLEAARGTGPDPKTRKPDPRRHDVTATNSSSVTVPGVAQPIILGLGTGERLGLDQRPCAYSDILVQPTIARGGAQQAGSTLVAKFTVCPDGSTTSLLDPTFTKNP